MRLIAVLVLLFLAGCGGTVLRVPDSAPESVTVTWVRVADLNDLSNRCRRSGLHGGEIAAACAEFLLGSGRCTIYTWRHASIETLGHEVAHCFLGAWHH